MASIVANPEAPRAGEPTPWDEMANGAGGLRAGWGAVLAAISSIGPEEMARRAEQLDRLLTADGVTGLLPGVTLSWRCDPMPLLIAAREWERLEAGLVQRATLIEAVLQDIYGPQTLLAQGRIPPSLIYANPAFLRPCRDPDGTATGRRLHLYAAELMRGPDGAWTVIADRTDDAGGLAYALENRRALLRVLPEPFRAYPMRRLTPFFEAWQERLLRLAPRSGRPGLALLTSGPDDKLWFEHVVLARELSCTLVESNDLTVRDTTLFLKTLQGLQRIDVLLRRQTGRTLDPLELEAQPRHGVTGLLDAARAGHLSIVNDPGTGVLEAPFWAAVLPDLALPLLGERLTLPTLPTLWLGDEAARRRLRADPHEWRMRLALEAHGKDLPPDRAAERLAVAPEDLVAVAPPLAATAPSYGATGLVPRPLVLRAYLMHDGQRWQAMPGGLARTLLPADLEIGRLPLHALCKDVWVASEEEQPSLVVAPSAAPLIPVRRMFGELPSRVAEHFFWLGRNLERLEGSARLLRTALDWLERPGSSPRESAELRTLATTLAAAGMIEPEAAGGLGPAGLATRLLQVASPPAELPGLLAEVSRLTEMLRDRLTREVHTTLTTNLRALGQRMSRLRSGEGSTRDLEQLCLLILDFAATVAGLAAENMVRSGGRLFLDLGRRIERAWSTTRMLAQVLEAPAGSQPGPLEPGLRLALEFCDSVITYRGRYLTTLQAGPLLDLVLADDGNPRAVAFQLVAIRDILAELARAPGAELPLAASASLREVREIARAAAEVAERQVSATLPPRLRGVEREVALLSSRIERQYFAVLPAARPLGNDE